MTLSYAHRPTAHGLVDNEVQKQGASAAFAERSNIKTIERSNLNALWKSDMQIFNFEASVAVDSVIVMSPPFVAPDHQCSRLLLSHPLIRVLVLLEYSARSKDKI